ncbi:hypothetical protein J6590_066152 [Homalodisca vitripennis]|nr:hypothetical protein J6590_066152 [Homalodisca vitripennis]
MGKGPPRIEIHEEEFRAVILSHIPLKEGEASSVPASPVKAGREWQTIMFRLGTNPINSNSHFSQQNGPIELSLHSRISTFSVSDLPHLDIHKTCDPCLNTYVSLVSDRVVVVAVPGKVDTGYDELSAHIAFFLMHTFSQGKYTRRGVAEVTFPVPGDVTASHLLSNTNPSHISSRLQQLPRTRVLKGLGVHFEHSLGFTHHIGAICRKASRMLEPITGMKKDMRSPDLIGDKDRGFLRHLGVRLEFPCLIFICNLPAYWETYCSCALPLQIPKHALSYWPIFTSELLTKISRLLGAFLLTRYDFNSPIAGIIRFGNIIEEANFFSDSLYFVQRKAAGTLGSYHQLSKM